MTTSDANEAAASEAGLGRSAMLKAGWRILPLIALSYGIAYMDRVNISFAAARMNSDLHFSATIYGIGGGLFFLSYALLEVPSSLILMRVGARRWLARIMITWGVLAVAMMFVTVPWQFYALRFLLGAAEAGFFPGVLIYLTPWFPNAYRARAVSRFYVAIPISQIVMGGLAGVLLGLHGNLGLSGWQWLFLLEGLPAVIMGFLVLFLLPDRPEDVPWLKAPEKDWIARRMAADALARGHESHNLLKAISNPTVLLLGLINFLFIGCNYALVLSAPQVLAKAGHMDITHAGYVIAASGVIGVFSMVLAGWSSDRKGERFWHMGLALFGMGAGGLVLALVHLPVAAIGGYLFMLACSFAAQGINPAIPGDILPARTAGISFAAINTISQCGSFVAPILWGISKDASGSYDLGLTLLPIGFVAAGALVLAMGRWRNRVRIAQEAAAVA
jgi:ACS family tartrate transporter-like MFS transporter